MKKLIAIDGNNILYRAYFALPSMMTKSGVPTGAIYGFLSTLFKLVQEKPDYLLVAFDMHGPTFRHEQYDAYKAGRAATPDDLRTQVPLMKKLLGEMGIAVCECPRFEADDILGTFARIANEGGADALLVTGDRDARRNAAMTVFSPPGTGMRCSSSAPIRMCSCRKKQTKRWSTMKPSSWNNTALRQRACRI